MKIFRFSSVLAAFVILTLLNVSAAEVSNITVDAKAALLIDISTGTVLYEQSADQIVYPASLTKIMTTLIALEQGNLDDVITVSETALENLDIDGSTVDLVAGEQLTLEQLLYCIMVSSANEACNVVAEYIAGDIDSFVAMMNQRAAELGCESTHFVNAHGLHDDNHYTTARDMSKITLEAIKKPHFLEICNTVAKEIPTTNKSGPRYLYTTNYLISDQRVSGYVYQYAKGVKTGHTTPAGVCLVSTAEKNNMTLLSVVLGAQSVVQGDGTTQIQSFTETAKLFDWGFSSFSEQTLITAKEPVLELPVSLALDVDAVVLHPESDITALLPNDFDPDLVERNIVIYDESPVAPVEKGAVLGELTLSYQGKSLSSVNLVALTNVSLSKTLYYSQEIGKILAKTWVKVIIVIVVVLILTYIGLLIAINLKKKRTTGLRGTYKGSSRKKSGRK